MSAARRIVGGLLAAFSLLVPLGPAHAAERDLVVQELDPIDVALQPQKLVGTDRRNIVVHPDRVDLLEGSETVWTTAERNRRRTRFDEVAALLVERDAPQGWIEQVEPGVYQLNVGFVQTPGTYMIFMAPAVRQVRLLDRPDVYIAGVGATARFNGVGVTSWNAQAGGPNTNPADPRPYLLYAGKSELQLARSDLGYLGADRSRAYGVVWDSGSTGLARESTFHHNFFGAYTFEGRDLTFQRNVFRDNAVYGLDPHDYTTGLVVEDNEAYANGSHGIIFSVGCTDGVVRRNYSHDNKANGIVMDNESNRVLVENNRVERNTLDGIVILGSSNVTVARNAVSGHRVGIRVNLNASRNRILANHVTDNQRGIELYGGAREGQLDGNLIERSQRTGLVLEAPASVSRGDRIDGAPVGVEVRSLARLEATSIANAERGLVVTERGIADVSGLDTTATRAGVHVKAPGLVRVVGSRLAAPLPLSGAPLRTDAGNVLTAPGRTASWLALAGLGFVVMAGVLQLLHRLRDRRRRRRSPGFPRTVVAARPTAPVAAGVARGARSARRARREGPEGVWNTY